MNGYSGNCFKFEQYIKNNLFKTGPIKNLHLDIREAILAYESKTSEDLELLISSQRRISPNELLSI